MATPLLQFNDKGIYCAQADVYIDAWKPVNRSIITHGHSDHARYGHNHYLTHSKNAPIIKHRLGTIQVETYEWNKPFAINGVTFSLHPAGHVLGSSQVRAEYKGEVWVFTGDYKTENDLLCTPFEPVKCHTLITECTFGLPAFKWRPQQEVMSDINQWWKENKAEGKTSVLFAYTLGKAQRILYNVDSSIGKIFTHGAVENMTNVLRSIHAFPETTLITGDTTKEEMRGNLVIAPPSAHGSPWMQKLVPYVTGSASGWMAFRGARRRRAIDKGFVLSDHCDWTGLLTTIKNTEAENIICTHGYTDIFSKYLRDIGYNACTQSTYYKGESLDEKESE